MILLSFCDYKLCYFMDSTIAVCTFVVISVSWGHLSKINLVELTSKENIKATRSCRWSWKVSFYLVNKLDNVLTSLWKEGDIVRTKNGHYPGNFRHSSNLHPWKMSHQCITATFHHRAIYTFKCFVIILFIQIYYIAPDVYLVQFWYLAQISAPF